MNGAPALLPIQLAVTQSDSLNKAANVLGSTF